MLVRNICSTKVFNMLVLNNNSFLVEVSIQEEWEQVGVPHLDNENKVIFLRLQLNKNFADNFLSIINWKIDTAIFFLCRSGSCHSLQQIL
ncbi:rickettsial conserved hypothetical protein [Rickettsia typhi str. Wilmington]|uniref:Uncharacterized protein n=3 Tax=Rickettsia typhi TaxID=785 RepID=Q68WD9_RICTY|nr:rickettsial conserved hypothetical protein [Rickettsia typhi str. Wilmington]AFE54432.1 hypothetical protein RTTH1527_02835 [Rickettsia typhi str. TH1527]AFE55270.1 hypothetical protein RTB9991CWPP_02835 [Rickettsia typhi str. B9991CWPP]CAC33734.1 hypothetical protein [Rickettsia typhi str. Wilmington]